jgi:hypothetical protein
MSVKGYRQTIVDCVEEGSFPLDENMETHSADGSNRMHSQTHAGKAADFHATIVSHHATANPMGPVIIPEGLGSVKVRNSEGLDSCKVLERVGVFISQFGPPSVQSKY